MNFHNDQYRVRSPLAAADRCSLPSTVDHLPSTALRGFTLAELLIVVLIISIVTVATIPFLKPALDSRRIREAARLFTSQLAAAQSQAIANGNSVGVWMEKIHMGGESSGAFEGKASTDLSLCEVPVPYAGDTQTSVVNVAVSGSTGVVTIYNASSPTGSVDTAWIGLLAHHDLIRFNGSDPTYQMTELNGSTDHQLFLPAPGNVNTTFTITPTDRDDFDTLGNPAFRHLPPAAFTSAGWTTPYQIIRQPVRSAGAPLQLPSGAIVDLDLSGMGSSNAFSLPSSDAYPILLMFDRTGAVECIYHGGTRLDVTSPLYFLIGKREGLRLSPSDSPSPDYVINYADPDNIWVTVNPRTGVASTTEVASVDSSAASFFSPIQLSKSRAYAISAQAMGGK